MPRALPRGTGSWAWGLAALGGVALANHLVAKASEKRHPPRGRFIDVDGVRLHYTDEGQGRPILLLHGNGAMVEEQTSSGLPNRLAEHGRVLIFDRPGFGHSTRPRGAAWTARAQAILFLKALKHLGVQRPVVVGHSWGTLAARAMALEDQGALGGLVLLSGYHRPEWRLDIALTSVSAVPVLGELMRYTISPLLGWLMAGGVFRTIFAPGHVSGRFRAQFPTALALRPSQLRATAEDTAFMTASAAAMRQRDGELTLPVMIVAGDGDAIVDPTRHSLDLHRRVRQSRLRMVRGAGHMVHHTATHEVADAIQLMLGEIEMDSAALPLA